MAKWIIAEKTKAGLRHAERDGKDQAEDSPKQAGSSWFARPYLLATSGVNLYPPGIFFADALALFFSGGTFVLCLLCFSSICFR